MFTLPGCFNSIHEIHEVVQQIYYILCTFRELKSDNTHDNLDSK